MSVTASHVIAFSGKVSDNQEIKGISIREFIAIYDAQLWDKQRDIDHERVDKIYAAQVEHIYMFNRPLFYGPIILCLFNYTYYIVDGQHRYYCMKKMIENNLINDFIIYVEIITVDNEDDIKRIFYKINQSVPVPVSYVAPNDIVNVACDQLVVRYPRNFSQRDKRFKRPKIQPIGLRDAIINLRLTEERNIGNPNDLFKLLIEWNEEYVKAGLNYLTAFMAMNGEKNREQIDRWVSQCKHDGGLIYGLLRPEYYGVWLEPLVQVK